MPKAAPLRHDREKVSEAIFTEIVVWREAGTRSYDTEHGATYALWGPWEEGPL